jgi:aldose 1-epimerase
VRYSAEQRSDQNVTIIRLTDAREGVEVEILPALGNRVRRMLVRGRNILYYPPGELADHIKNPELGGIPFLAPWADLLDEPAFWANGKRYGFNMGLGNVRGERPIHGLLTACPHWQIMEAASDGDSAHVTSRLEFWKYPDLMAQWPFAHEYEITHRLDNGVLEVKTTVTNLSTEPMPIAIGFHPYFQIPGVPREEWIAHLAARTHVIADEHQIPTGEMRPLDIPNPLPLRGEILDDGFADLERDAEGCAHFTIEAGGQAIETLFGPNYRVATVYLPPLRPWEPQEFICIEPLTAIINGVNLSRQGKYSDLQTVTPGGEWTESFWIGARA